MLIGIGITLFAILIFLFIFWKRLKEDYSAEIIFKTSTYILAGTGIGWIISLRFFPAWFFWTSFIGGTIGLTTACLLLKVKFYETFEAFVVSTLPGLSLIFLNDSVIKSSLSSFSAFLAILFLIFISYYFDTHYKKFSWYTSGRIGFAGIATAGLLFLTRSVIAILKVPVLSFVGRSEVVISGVLMIASFVLLYNLGRIKK